MGGSGRVPLGVFLLVFTSACATAGGSALLGGLPWGDEDAASLRRMEPGDRSDSWRPTLLVENSSGEQIAVRVNGSRVGTATGGRTCIRIPRVMGPLVLEFDPVGTDSELALPVYLESSIHWKVEVRPGPTLKYDVLSMMPAENGCMR